MLPDGNIRYWPRKLVPFALEAGWAVHPDAKPGDWAVIMVRAAVSDFIRPSRQIEVV
jgi:hypothetical protein